MKAKNNTFIRFAFKTGIWFGGILSIFLFLLAGCAGNTDTVPPQANPTATSLLVAETKTPVKTVAENQDPTPTLAVELVQTKTPTLEQTNEPQPTPTAIVLDATPTAAVETTPEPTQVSVTEPKPERNCTDVAAFVEDVTIPDGTLFKAGDEFEKTWRIQNAGTCVWEGYQLVYAGGEAMNGISSPIQTINPKEYANLSIKLNAPNRGGTHIGNWLFVNSEGKSFGVGVPNTGTLWVEIKVDYPSVSVSPGSGSTGSSGKGSGSGSSTASACNFSPNADYINLILALVNGARIEQGLQTLEFDSQLAQAAQSHSIDMACNALISHNGSDGSLWYDRVKAQGFANYNSARENIYAGNPDFGGDAEGAFVWWMNSPTHRANILYENVSRIGIGYAFYDKGDIHGFYTMVVARP